MKKSVKEVLTPILQPNASRFPIALGLLVASSQLGYGQLSYARVTGSTANQHLSGTGSLSNYDVSDRILFTSTDFSDAYGTAFDIVGVVNAKNDPSTVAYNLARVVGTDNWVDMTLNFVVPGSATTATPNGIPLPVSFHSLLVVDIDSNPGGNFTDVMGIETSASRILSADTFLEGGGFGAAAGAPSGLKYTRLRRDAAGDPTDWTDEGNDQSDWPNKDPRNSVAFDFGLNPITETRFVWGSRGDDSLTDLERGASLAFENTMVVPEPSTALLGLFSLGLLARRKRG